MKEGRTTAHNLTGHMFKWKQEECSPWVTNVSKEADKLSSFKIKVTITWLNIGGLGEGRSTLCNHHARCNKKQMDVYLKGTKLPGMELLFNSPNQSPANLTA